jgi:hypothetical protein
MAWPTVSARPREAAPSSPAACAGSSSTRRLAISGSKSTHWPSRHSPSARSMSSAPCARRHSTTGTPCSGVPTFTASIRPPRRVLGSPASAVSRVGVSLVALIAPASEPAKAPAPVAPAMIAGASSGAAVEATAPATAPTAAPAAAPLSAPCPDAPAPGEVSRSPPIGYSAWRPASVTWKTAISAADVPRSISASLSPAARSCVPIRAATMCVIALPIDDVWEKVQAIAVPMPLRHAALRQPRRPIG